jgi:hypothetical protein
MAATIEGCRTCDTLRGNLSMWVDAPPHHVHLVLEPRCRGRAEAGGATAFLLQEWRRRQGPPEPTAAEKVRDALARRWPGYAPR